MNKKIIVKPSDDLTEVELRRLESELSTIGGFDFWVIKSSKLVKDYKESLENEKAIFEKFAKPQTPKIKLDTKKSSPSSEKTKEG